MRFRILGPLEVTGRGGVLRIGSPAERHLLAVLVCLPNETVSVERLIDELWGEDPPPTARNMVQRYVSRLRRSLGDPTGDRLATEAGGYRLRVDDEELDWFRFESMVDRAHALEDPEVASALLTEALALWRGPPLVGAGHGPTLVAERVRLAEARLAALEERIERDLERGRHDELVTELTGLTERFPLRERLRSELMLALYRSGRQAEALRVFAAYRGLLGEEAGLEPGSAVAALEERILLGDSDLDIPHAATPPRHNLPFRVARFIGRGGEIASVIDLLHDRRLVTLTGTGGVGKTSLAITIAAESVQAFPGGAWLVELAGVPESNLIGGAVAGALQVADVPGEDITQTLARNLGGIEILIVLDNCEHMIDGAAKFVRSLLQAASGVHVLATSRESLAIPGEAIFVVPSLEIPGDVNLPPPEVEAMEAVTLFVDRGRLVDPSFALDYDNAAAVAEICRRLDGIPLAIELAAARLATATPRQVADRLDDRFHFLTKGRRTAPDRHQTLEALVDWSHDFLAEPVQVLLRRLSVFGGGFTLGAAEDVCGFDPIEQDSVADLLERLIDTSLVILPQPGSHRYRMLETIRQYARRKLDAAGETDRTVRRMAVYLFDAGPESLDGIPGSDAAAWFEWRDQEQDNYRAVLSWAVAKGDQEVASRSLIELQNWLAVAGRERELRDWTGAVLALLEDEQTHRRIRLLGSAAAGEVEHGDTARAHHLIEELRSSADARGELSAAALARALGGLMAFKAGDLDRALDLNARAADLYEQAGDPLYLNCIENALTFHIVCGRYDDAEDLADRAQAEIARFAKPQDPKFIGLLARQYKALVAFSRGDYRAVKRILEPSLDYARLLGPGEQTPLSVTLGYAGLASGQAAEARQHAEDAALTVDEAGSLDLLWQVRTLQALVALESPDIQSAATHLEAALGYAEKFASVVALCEVIGALADTALAADDPAEAAVLHAAATTGRGLLPVVLGLFRQRRFNQALCSLWTILGSDAFERLWNEGSELPLDAAVVRARRLVLKLLASSPDVSG